MKTIGSQLSIVSVSSIDSAVSPATSTWAPGSGKACGNMLAAQLADSVDRIPVKRIALDRDGQHREITAGFRSSTARPKRSSLASRSRRRAIPLRTAGEAASPSITISTGSVVSPGNSAFKAR